MLGIFRFKLKREDMLMMAYNHLYTLTKISHGKMALIDQYEFIEDAYFDSSNKIIALKCPTDNYPPNYVIKINYEGNDYFKTNEYEEEGSKLSYDIHKYVNSLDGDPLKLIRSLGFPSVSNELKIKSSINFFKEDDPYNTSIVVISIPYSKDELANTLASIKTKEHCIEHISEYDFYRLALRSKKSNEQQ